MAALAKRVEGTVSDPHFDAKPGEDAIQALLRVTSEENIALRREVARLNRELERLENTLEDERVNMTTYFGLVAHQLKSPLLPLDVSLITIARAIERRTPLPEDTFPRTLRQTRRLARLIETLLVDMPRIEQGSLRVVMASFDLRRPVERAVNEARTMREAREFSLHAPEDAIRVRGDVERIEQIVCALLDNAVKYSPPDALVSICISVDEDAQAIVSVTDRGIGIPPRELRQVFTKFYRGSNAPCHLYRGLGVGLYVSDQFARLCGGYLTLESVEGEGTVCRLHIPVER